jgi:hypothetical protein
MNPETIRPLGDRLLLHKCINEEVQDGIIIPEKTADNTNFCAIVAIGPKCKVEWPVGAIVRVTHDYHNDLVGVPDTEGAYWFAKEGLVEPMIYG